MKIDAIAFEHFRWTAIRMGLGCILLTHADHGGERIGFPEGWEHWTPPFEVPYKHDSYLRHAGTGIIIHLWSQAEHEEHNRNRRMR